MLSKEQQIYVEENQKLVYLCLKKLNITFSDQNYEDMVQEGMIGLCCAAERYDPARGSFSTFAIPTITGYIKKYRHEHCQPGGIKPPAWATIKRNDIPPIDCLYTSAPIKGEGEEMDLTLGDTIPDPSPCMALLESEIYTAEVLDRLDHIVDLRFRETSMRQRIAKQIIRQLRSGGPINQTVVSAETGGTRQLTNRVMHDMREWATSILRRDSMIA